MVQLVNLTEIGTAKDNKTGRPISSFIKEQEANNCYKGQRMKR